MKIMIKILLTLTIAVAAMAVVVFLPYYVAYWATGESSGPIDNPHSWQWIGMLWQWLAGLCIMIGGLIALALAMACIGVAARLVYGP